MAYYRHQKDGAHKAVVDELAAKQVVAFDVSPLAGLGFDVVLHGKIRIVEDMQYANAEVEKAAGTDAHIVAITQLALLARQFLRQYASGQMAIGFLPVEIKNPEPVTRTYTSSKRKLQPKETRQLTASELKVRSKAPIPCIRTVEEALSYF